MRQQNFPTIDLPQTRFIVTPIFREPWQADLILDIVDGSKKLKVRFID
ncbi:hypothetical protein [Hydrocoleum sp. CS-953]|nr:hypothetical protein [Hydrocoleum sp. CS-953]